MPFHYLVFRSPSSSSSSLWISPYNGRARTTSPSKDGNESSTSRSVSKRRAITVDGWPLRNRLQVSSDNSEFMAGNIHAKTTFWFTLNITLVRETLLNGFWSISQKQITGNQPWTMQFYFSDQINTHHDEGLYRNSSITTPFALIRC